MLKRNLLSIKIICTLIMGVALITAITFFIVLWEMNNRYVDSMGISTGQIIEKIRGELHFTGDAAVNIIQSLRSRQALRAKINDNENTSAWSSYAIDNLAADLEAMLSDGLRGKLSVAVVGKSGMSYVSGGSLLTTDANELMNRDFSRIAAKSPGSINYQFIPDGFTTASAGQGVLVASASIFSGDEADPVAYVYIIITQNQLRDYNTLTSVKWLIWQGNNEKAAQAIDSFTRLISGTVGNNTELITVEEEMALVENYITLQQIRFGERIRVDCSVDEACSQAMIHKFIMQPFIENAFFHAFPSNQNGVINIFITRREDRMLIEIIDDGVGISGGKYEQAEWYDIAREQNFKGIGISNVCERIRLLYGNEYRITISSESGKGMLVRIPLPYMVN